MNDTPKGHEPCPFCDEADPERFSVMGWPHPQAPDWMVVVCSSCQAQGPPVERKIGELKGEHARNAWLYWDMRRGES